MADEKSPRLTRKEVAKVLGCSTGTVQMLEIAKKLTPIHVNGRVFFDAVEVECCDWKPKRKRRRIVTSYKFKARGRLEARLMQLFKAKVPWQDAVIDTQADSDFVLECYRRFGKTADELAIEAEIERQEKEFKRETKSREWRDWQLAMKRAGAPPGTPHPGRDPSVKGDAKPKPDA